MRPTDEDQSGSRRPNLMSPTRRTASETNILAMLDRHQAGGPGRRLLRGLQGVPAMAWYGAAGVLVIGLVGSLAWLARDSGAPSPADGAVAGAAASNASPVAAAPPLDAPAASASAEAVPAADAGPAEPPPAAGATIVDLAPADPPAPTPASAVSTPRALPPQEHAGRILPRDERSAFRHEHEYKGQRLAAAVKPPRTAGAKPAAVAQAPAQARVEARGRRNAAATKQAPAAVDTDVALISAIIQHASKRQDAEDEARKP
ncbi:hypothetical protein ACFQ09_02305 [Massilia norwichensis]|uniref:Uncharacterized protein n=1 Tax=Massilia norwichensis TaxID=1442366 RepID=A0ABT2A7R5_9BURK|nr:hypothetical protein [Massilia norwichensis]MCS0590231.1 hypothetical protein [Massilia norwichensis]